MNPVRRLARRVATALFKRFPSLTERWLARNPVAREDDVPWTPLGRPVASCRVALVTTAGVHTADQRPFDMEDSDGDPGWRPLPGDTPPDGWRITHDYYDTAPARRDLDVVFPLRRLRELAAAGRIGGLVDVHAGLMGHVDGRHVATLRDETAPEVARHLRDQRADLVLLAPA